MALGSIIGAILLVVCVGGFLFFAKEQKKKGKSKTKLIGITVGLVALVLLAIVPMSFHTVEAGQVAVVKTLGKATGIRTAGTYFDFWLFNTYDIYDAKVQNLQINTAAYSKDAQTMQIEMMVQYHIDSVSVIEIANQYGALDVLESRIRGVAENGTKSILTTYSAMEIIEKRSPISTQIEETIKDAIDGKYYVNIATVVLTNIDFTDAFEKTVEEKMIAEQEKLKAEYEKETAIVNAEKELAVAKLKAEAAAAEIKLKSIEIARMLGFNILETEITNEEGTVTGVEYSIDFTDKTPEEIRLISEYLKYADYLAKWNGELPGVVVTDGNASVILPTP